MPIQDVIQHNFKIYFEDNGNKFPLPYAFYTPSPKFVWDVPQGVSQQSYIFEMRTQYPVLFSDGKTYKCAYYSSGRIYSSSNFHIITTIAGQQLQLSTWAGVCEIRLRIFTKNETEYCSHDIIEDDTEYDFEYTPQRRLWGSRNDRLYFCLDEKNDNLLNQCDAKINFRTSVDDDYNQKITYELQLSDSPLFGEGLYSKSLIKVENILANDIYVDVDISFQNEKNIEKLVPERIDALRPNVLYYCRVRSFDGYDYSDWAKVDSILMVLNSLPKPKIHGVYYPSYTIIGNDGNLLQQLVNVNDLDNEDTALIVQQNRSAGELIIQLSIQDDDNDYVSCELSFSMLVNSFESQRIGCSVNNSEQAISYYEQGDKLIRVRTSETLIKVPTSKILGDNHIFIVWYTAKQILNTYKNGVFLYCLASDGFNENLLVTHEYKINNIGINNEGTVEVPNLRWWNKGSFSRSLYYPVLPQTMLRQLLYGNNGVIIKQTNTDNNQEQQKNGSIGYTQGTQNAGTNWFDYWNNYEDGSITIYPADDSDDKQSSSKQSYGIGRITQEQGFNISQYDKYYEEGANEKEDPIGVTIQTIKANGFVSFCPECDELNILKTVVLMEDGKIFNNLSQAFPDGKYRGISYTLNFQCPECKKMFPLSTKYQQNLSCGVKAGTRQDYYSYYYGYNSDNKFLNNNELSKSLLLTLKKEYDAEKEKWEQTHEENDKYPYEFLEVFKGESNKDALGFTDENILLNLQNRPQISPYFKLKTPQFKNIHFAPYIDGTQLNASIQKDYMYGYEPSKGGVDLQGNSIPADQGDPDLIKLAGQSPWNILKKMMSIYVQGKKSLKQEDFKKEGYVGAQSGDQQQQQESEEESLDTQVSLKESIHVCFDAENPCVTHYYDTNTNITTVYNRIACKFKIKFPLIIEKNVNDKFKIKINDEILIQDSLLFGDNTIQICNFPFNDDKTNNSYFSNIFGQNNGYLKRMFGGYLQIPDSITSNNKEAFNYMDSVDTTTQTIQFTLYGNKTSALNKMEILSIDKNCYELFSLQPVVSYQSYRNFWGNIGAGFLYLGTLPSESDSGAQLDASHEYYYCKMYESEKKFDFEESPVDNTIEDEFGMISKQIKGQPMFTCYKDQVDVNGYHFKYTQQDFKKTGKIYVRKYHIQMCNPCPKSGFGPNNNPGYRDWITVPIDPVNKPGRYYKKKVLKMRGVNHTLKLIDVFDDDKIVQQYGYFTSNDENAECISHKKPQSSSSSDQEEKDTPIIYTRLPLSEWRNNILTKTCVVFQYVDILQAIAKNPLEMAQGIPPLNHHCPINIKGGNFVDVVKRYGVYVMGGYDLTEDQKQIKNNGLSYEKTFSSMVPVLGENGKVSSSAVEYTDIMPNNWRPQLINSIFDVDSNDKKSVNVSIMDNKKGQLVQTGINSIDKYQQHWQGKLEPIKAEMADRQLSQYTVEQFNPAFKYQFKIQQKWGYQPKKHNEDYFKVDEDSLYGYNKYIPSASRIVHAIHEDEWADIRLTGQYIKQRKIISDKSFSDDKEDCDKLPFLDYRLIGENNREAREYYAGYMTQQDEVYKNRLQPVYKQNKPFKIGGLNRKQYAEINMHPYYEMDYQYVQGAYIDKLLSYDSYAIFYYLQDEWNTYNRIHWASIHGVNQYGCLYAQQVYSTGETIPGKSQFSIRTVTSIWVEQLSAWCIPYNSSMSDLVDTFNSGMQDGKYYKFYLKLIDKTSLQTGATPIISKVFKISSKAISPVNIISTEYDVWTKNLTLTIRFDDALGREYDIVGIYHSIHDEVVDGQRYNNWIEGSVQNIKGEILGLASNKTGDNVKMKNMIITHKIVINIDDFNITPTGDLRIRLFSSLALDRAGLTLPIFNVTMWANQFLKPIQDNLRSLQGYVADYIYQQTYNEQEQKMQGKWVYVGQDKATRIPGSIEIAQNKLNLIDEDFQKYFSQHAIFEQADVDAIENCIKNSDMWKDFYFIFVFDKFLALFQDKIQDYNFFKSENNQYVIEKINQLWLKQNNLLIDFEKYYKENRMNYLLEYKKQNGFDFNKWFLIHYKQIDYVQLRKLYAQAFQDDFNYFYGIIQEQNYGDSSSSSGTIFTDSDYMNFIIQNDRLDGFIKFCCVSINFYSMDSRFIERAAIMFKDYGINTAGIFEYSNSNENAWKFQDWKIKNQGIYSCLSDEYQAFLIEENKDNVVNYGRQQIYSLFLNTLIEGDTYLAKLSSISTELVNLQNQRKQYLNIKNQVETDHRIRLIKQGYFCNGFENNKPYKDNGDVNVCFRWRVETRAYEGSIQSNTVYDSEGNTLYGYQERFDMYLRFQMDFYDTFDSQNGLPLRDIIFKNDDKTERILMGINTSQHIAKTTPNDVSSPQKTLNIPASLQVAQKEDGTYQTSAYNMNSLQYNVQFSLKKSQLPGRYVDDICPEIYKNGWVNTIGNDFSSLDNFKSIYFWQVAPYNIVERPVFQIMISPFILTTEDKKRTIVFDNLFNNENILYSNFDFNEIYVAIQKLQYRYENSSSSFENQSEEYVSWKRNSLRCCVANQSALYDINAAPYNNDWINLNKLQRGEVDFITDRPRELIFDQINQESSSSLSLDEILSNNFYDGYLVSINDSQFSLYKRLENSYTCVDFELYPLYVREFMSNNNKQYMYLYCAKINKEISWFISNNMPNIQQNSPFQNNAFLKMNKSSFIIKGFPDQSIRLLNIYSGNETNNGYWLFKSSSQYLLSQNKWFSKGVAVASNTIIIKQSLESSSSNSSSYPEQFFTKARLDYIPDNINNFNTYWIPDNVERHKPFVLKLDKQYLLFSHKTFFSDKSKVITLSRGFSNDIFGQESMCFPKYTYQSLSDVIPNAISFENPCVIKISENLYRMYFNVVFQEQDVYVNKIYKADTNNFEDWFDFQMIKIENSYGEVIFNCLEPNVVVTKVLNPDFNAEMSQNTVPQYINKFEMYVSSKQYNESYYTIKYYISNDGINYHYHETINDYTDGWYNCYSPFVYQSQIQKKLYFTMVSPPDNFNEISQIIVSLDWDFINNQWSEQAINDTARLIVEKGSEEMQGLPFNGWNGVAHYKNPCVIQDVDLGVPVKRLYYNTYDTPYGWYEKQLVEAEGKTELTIHTEYLQEYKWKKQSINQYQTSSISANDKVIYSSYDYYEQFEGLPTNAKIKCQWYSSLEEDCLAIKINVSAKNSIVECISQGDWINYNNIKNTQAKLSPEEKSNRILLDDGVSLYLKFINAKQLNDQFIQWNEQFKGNYQEFIMAKNYYSQYLWWLFEGNGIYRYIGWDVINMYNWLDDE